MNFVILTREGSGQPIRINLDHVQWYETTGQLTCLCMVNGMFRFVKETPEQIDQFVSGMAAFTGHVPGVTFNMPFIGPQPEQR